MTGYAFFWDDEFWATRKYIGFLGEELTVTIVTETNDHGPTARQIAAIDALDAIDASIVDALDDWAEVFRKDFDAAADLAYYGLGHIQRENIHEHYTITDVIIPALGACETDFQFLVGRCEWEDEHGIAFLLEDGKVRLGGDNGYHLYLNEEWDRYIGERGLVRTGPAPGFWLKLPDDLEAFLEARELLCYDADTCEAGAVTLRGPGDLKLQLFPVEARMIATIDGLPIIKDDPNYPATNSYQVLAVDLVATASGEHAPQGLLVWLPREHRYGIWDRSRRVVRMFPADTGWSDIARDPASHINAAWEHDGSSEMETLVPWESFYKYGDEQFHEPREIA